jgi:hypothetical protein
MKHTTLTLLTAVAFSTASVGAYADNNWKDSAMARQNQHSCLIPI